LNRVRQDDLSGVVDLTAFRDHPRELLGVQRVSACTGQNGRLYVRRQNRSLQNGVDKLSRLQFGQRRQRQCRGIRLAAAPVRTAREELGARRGDDKERHVRRPVDQRVDEVEQAVVGPVEILEDEHGRALCGKALQEAAPGCERLAAPVPAGGVVGYADEWLQHPSQPLDLLLAAHAHYRVSELRLGDRSRVAFENPGLGLDHFT